MGRQVLALFGWLILAYWGFPGPAKSSTWLVTYDPSDDHGRIDAVVQQASSGDTVVVEPGTYYEHIDASGKSLSLLSLEGAEVTILDGNWENQGKEGSIVYNLGSSASLHIEGFTLQNGSGAEAQLGQLTGGAICWWATGSDGDLAIKDCVFENNSVGPGVSVLGGAIGAVSTRKCVIESCEFRGNLSEDFGGAIAIQSGSDEISLITDCNFDVPRTAEWAGGAAVWIDDGRVELSGNTFAASVGTSWVPGILTQSVYTKIHNNSFLDLGGALATWIEMRAPNLTGNPLLEVDIAGNLVSSAQEDGMLSIVFNRGAVRLISNTLVGCSTDIHLAAGEPIVFNRNILFGSPTEVECAAGGEVRCNDIWSGDLVDILGNLSIEANLHEDPLFCDLPGGNFSLSEASGCATGNSPPGCEQIGAYGVGCEGNPVESTSFGRIKQLFRGR